jgi:hypothetical protein
MGGGKVCMQRVSCLARLYISARNRIAVILVIRAHNGPLILYRILHKSGHQELVNELKTIAISWRLKWAMQVPCQTMDAAIISKHLPIITARIQFSQSSPAILPITTPRIGFAHMNGLHTISPASDHVVTPDEMDVDSQSSRGSSDSEIEGISNPSQDLIQKPPGEAGRPGSGGFNLEESLGWPRGVFEKISVSYIISLPVK